MSPPAVIGLDLGTTGARAVLADVSGATLAVHEAPYDLHTPRPGWAEQSPEDWERAAFSAISAVASRARREDDIRAIGLTGQMHGLTLLDRAQQPLRDAILWCDLRTGPQRRELEDAIGVPTLVRHTGNLPLEGFQAPKIVWVRQHEPDLLERTAHVLLPKDFIRLRLSGECLTDVSDASGTGYFDSAKRRWSDQMIDMLAIDRAWLPEIRESPEPASRLTPAAAERLGLRPGIPIAAGAGDQPAGAVAAGVVSEGDAAVTIGSSGVVFAAASAYGAAPDGRVQVGAHALPQRWYLMGVTQAAGLSLRWLRDTFMPGTSYDQLVPEATDSSPGSRGLLWLPYLQGERTPHLDAEARGALVGLTTAHGRADIVRAVLEGVAFSLRDAAQAIQGVGAAVDRFKLAGGGARSPLWRQIVADVFDTPMRVEPEGRGPAFGAALLGAVASGLFASVDEAVRVTAASHETITPSAEGTAALDAAYARYRDLYPALAATSRSAAAFQAAETGDA
ncbi:MAG: xylulokinase [Chloroflexota bacterium]|nr:xylulokinase [Chloroflexota bacterium]MDE2921164.1 xylulokinase [Chloroflexota bacterium]